MDEIFKKEAMEIRRICETYGYGSVMEWASAFYRYHLKEDGLPPEHAYVPVIPFLCDKDDDGVKLGEKTRELYDRMVECIMGGEK